jgi:curved DNA-binding protein CbpA
MSFKIDSGLFKLDFTDHHAILGVPVDADFKDIRKRYLQIARRLHPDSCTAQSEADKQRASQLLSKLVNPAYEKFSKDAVRAEYIVLVKQMGKRLAQESSSIELKNELSKQLAQTNNIEHTYKTSVSQLAQKQYDSFDQVLQLIAQISELNLVYLKRKGGNALQLSPPSVGIGTNPGGKNAASPPSPPPPAPTEPETVIEQYFRRAQALMAKNNFAQARVELQDALKLEPNNSRCHSLMGVVYLKQNQATMAKVHINKALQLNPRDPMALKAKQLLDQVAQKAGAQQVAPSKTSPGKPTQEKPLDKSGGGGLFGGLFGGKKK